MRPQPQSLVVGHRITTTNEGNQSMSDMQKLRQTYLQDATLQSFDGPTMVVYTHYTEDRQSGNYDVYIGKPSTQENESYESVHITETKWKEFSTSPASPDGVIGLWQKIRSDTDLTRSYTQDIEIYAPDMTTASIFIAIK